MGWTVKVYYGRNLSITIDGVALGGLVTAARRVRKRCVRCGSRRARSKFHADAAQMDGLSRRCKACVSEQTAAWAQRNREAKNKTDREWKRRNRHKDRARGVVRRALAKGTLVKPKACSCCRRHSAGLEAHHLDYARPLLVVWLCKRCHAAHHDWGRFAAANEDR